MPTMYFAQNKPMREAMLRVATQLLYKTGISKRISFIEAMKPNLGFSRHYDVLESDNALVPPKAIPAKAPPPRVIQVRLTQRLRGRACLARLLRLDCV